MKTQYIILALMFLSACKSSRIPEPVPKAEYNANPDGKGTELVFDFTRGQEHNHPSFVLWAETMDGSFIQTLFASEAVATSVYDYGDPSEGKWMPGVIRRPAALPYWSHKRGILESDGLYTPSPENPVPDAYTGATPEGDFSVTARFDEPPPRKFRIMFEINQTWDWNEYWTNNKYPDDEEYKTSCQPALVYMAEVDLDDPAAQYELKPIGHSHHSGMNGALYPDLGTITTALQIADRLVVSFR